MQPRTALRGVRVRALAALLSAAAVTALSGCGGSDGGPSGSDEPGVSSSEAATTAPPGKYQTLPEPCGSVTRTTLRDLLPTAADYAGTAMPTYDTDRRVGCAWTGTAAGANRSLSIDFERVVSYDPSVSDEDKAGQEFAAKAAAAHIPDGTPSADDSTSVPAPGQSAAAGDDAGDTTPRRVGGVGDEAYLDYAAQPDGAGTRQDVTMVFRTANVLVTIEFDQWSDDPAAQLSGADLELGARGLAQELAKVITH